MYYFEIYTMQGGGRWWWLRWKLRSRWIYKKVLHPLLLLLPPLYISSLGYLLRTYHEYLACTDGGGKVSQNQEGRKAHSTSSSSFSISTATPAIFRCELSTRPHGLHSLQSLFPGGGASSCFSNMEARLLTKNLFMVSDGREFRLLFLMAHIVPPLMGVPCGWLTVTAFSIHPVTCSQVSADYLTTPHLVICLFFISVCLCGLCWEFGWLGRVYIFLSHVMPSH